MADLPAQVVASLSRSPYMRLARSKCSCYVLFYSDRTRGIEIVMSKLDFWAVVAVGTQLTLAAIVQVTVLS